MRFLVALLLTLFLAPTGTPAA